MALKHLTAMRTLIILAVAVLMLSLTGCTAALRPPDIDLDVMFRLRGHR